MPASVVNLGSVSETTFNMVADYATGVAISEDNSLSLSSEGPSLLLGLAIVEGSMGKLLRVVDISLATAMHFSASSLTYLEKYVKLD